MKHRLLSTFKISYPLSYNPVILFFEVFKIIINFNFQYDIQVLYKLYLHFLSILIIFLYYCLILHRSCFSVVSELFWVYILARSLTCHSSSELLEFEPSFFLSLFRIKGILYLLIGLTFWIETTVFAEA